MIITIQVITLLSTLCGFCYAFGGKTQMNRSNGAKIMSAGLIALAVIAAWRP